jgi:hypothetical protein
MAFFNQAASKTESVPTSDEKVQAGTQSANPTSEADFLNEFAGEGVKDITAEAVATPWISIMQEKTQHVIDGECEAGVWRNSSSGVTYGKTIRVIPVSFKVIWNEKDADGKTVANYEPGSIHVEHVPARAGQGFATMKNPDSGFKVEETFLYAVVNADAPHEGYCLLQASMGSIGTFKRWNAQLRAQILPNGARAPLFAYVWELSIGDDQARNKRGQMFYKMTDVRRAELISKQVFLDGVQQNRQIALNAQLAIAAPAEGDATVETIEE